MVCFGFALGVTLKRDCFAGYVLMLSSISSDFHFATMVKKEKEEEGDSKVGRNL